MADTPIAKVYENHVDQLKALREQFIKERGSFKTRDGHTVAKTTNHDVQQLLRWWHLEYIRARARRPGYKDPAQRIWEEHVKRINADLQGADPDALYRDNHWFWNTAILKLAIYLQGQKSTPSAMSIFWESLTETIEERASDVGKVIETAANAAEAISTVGERAWSGIKIAAIVGGSLIGVAIVAPPIIRAFRTPTTPAE